MITLPVKYMGFFYCFVSKCCKHSLLHGFENIHGLDQVFSDVYFYFDTNFFPSSMRRAILSEEYGDIEEII